MPSTRNKQILVRLAYRVNGWRSYQKTKDFFRYVLEDPQSAIRPYFDIVMITLVLASVAVLVYGSKDGNELGPWAYSFELFAVMVFAIEYLLRMWLYSDLHKMIIEQYEKAEYIGKPFRLFSCLWTLLKSKLHYMRQPMAIIDLLAIVPSYRPLRFLRVFLLFRLFKLFRYTRSITSFVRVLVEKKTELFTLAFFLAFVMLVSALTLYYFEINEADSKIHSFFDALYWALVTISTVGFGDITPVTPEGKVITMALIIAGLGVISFFTSIIVSAFTDKMAEIREHRVLSELERHSNISLVCGFGRIGRIVCDKMIEDGVPFVVVEADDEAAGKARSAGFLVVEGDARDVHVLEKLGLGERVKRLLCLFEDDSSNVFVTLLARNLNREVEIIARVNKPENQRKLQMAGANHTVHPYAMVAHLAADFIDQPLAFNAVHSIVTGDENVLIEAVRISLAAGEIDLCLDSFSFADNRLVLFGVLRSPDKPALKCANSFPLSHHCFYFNPDISERICPDDLLVLIGHPYSINHFREMWS